MLHADVTTLFFEEKSYQVPMSPDTLRDKGGLVNLPNGVLVLITQWTETCPSEPMSVVLLTPEMHEEVDFRNVVSATANTNAVVDEFTTRNTTRFLFDDKVFEVQIAPITLDKDNRVIGLPDGRFVVIMTWKTSFPPLPDVIESISPEVVKCLDLRKTLTATEIKPSLS